MDLTTIRHTDKAAALLHRKVTELHHARVIPAETVPVHTADHRTAEDPVAATVEEDMAAVLVAVEEVEGVNQ